MELRDIDIHFDFRTDTRPGKDPDCDSKTLRAYQQLLWSKPLPNGEVMKIEIEGGYLKWKIRFATSNCLDFSCGFQSLKYWCRFCNF